MIKTNSNLRGKGNAMADSRDDAEPIDVTDGQRVDYADQALDQLLCIGGPHKLADAFYEYLRETLVDRLVTAARSKRGPYDQLTDARALLVTAAEEWANGLDAETIAGSR